MGYFYICPHTFTLSDLFTKSMKFYVQKNNKCYFHIEKKKKKNEEEGREERREGKTSSETKIIAPQRHSEFFLPTHQGTHCPGKTT